jgi:hypothetical protein
VGYHQVIYRELAASRHNLNGTAHVKTDWHCTVKDVNNGNVFMTHKAHFLPPEKPI